MPTISQRSNIVPGLLKAKAKKRKRAPYEEEGLSPGKSRPQKGNLIAGLGVGSALNSLMRLNPTGSVASTSNGVARDRRFGTYQSPGGM